MFHRFSESNDKKVDETEMMHASRILSLRSFPSSFLDSVSIISIPAEISRHSFRFTTDPPFLKKTFFDATPIKLQGEPHKVWTLSAFRIENRASL